MTMEHVPVQRSKKIEMKKVTFHPLTPVGNKKFDILKQIWS